MRYALLADVHGNLEALEAVLRDLADWPDVRLICAGDIVGYGPDPAACFELLASWRALMVMGNHEAMVLGRLGFERCVPRGIRAALWTRRELPTSVLEGLAALPPTLHEGPLLVCHASLSDLETYVSSPAQAARELELMAARVPEARLLVCGHTHRPMLYTGAAGLSATRPEVTSLRQVERALVNPGSVGQPREGELVARYARYDDSTDELSFRAVPYQHARTRYKLRRTGLAWEVALRPPRGPLTKAWASLHTRLARRLAGAPPAAVVVLPGLVVRD